MEIKLDLKKSVEKNAEFYFENAKKFKKKLSGVKKAIEISRKKLDEAEKKEIEKSEIEQEKIKNKPVRTKKEWYEKFRWFVSSDGFLVIGGRDATTNEIVIKKYTDDNDMVFHTEMAGSPFVIVKNPEKKEIPETTLKESAEFCASFARAWKNGLTSAEVFMVKPEQVSKEAKSGEYISKGSFMIYGHKKKYNVIMNIGIGNYNNKIMSAPVSAIRKNCSEFVEIAQGTEKVSDVAKAVQKIIGGNLDEIIRSLPSGCSIRKKAKTMRIA